MDIILNILHWWFFDFYLTTVVFCFALVGLTFFTRLDYILENVTYIIGSLPDDNTTAIKLKKKLEIIKNSEVKKFTFREKLIFLKSCVNVFIPFYRFFYTIYIVSMGFMDISNRVSEEEIQSIFGEIQEEDRSKEIHKAHKKYMKNKTVVDKAYDSLKDSTKKAISEMDGEKFAETLGYIDKKNKEAKQTHSEDEYIDI